MEFSLNLAWLLLATTSGAILGRRAFRSDDSKRPGFPKWHFVVALGLCLVTLFFVISMTDDLHEQQSIAEESGSSRVLPKTNCPASSGKQFATPDFPQALVIDTVRHCVTSLCLGHVEERCLSDSSLFQRPTAGRAPPTQFA